MRYLTLADIHADATTLHRVLQATHGNYDQVILLGDYVGYGPEPLETLHMLRTLPIHTAILGNHDLAVLHRARGRETNRNRSPLEDIWSTHAAALDGASVAWLEDLALRGVVRGSNPAGDVGASEIVEGGPLDQDGASARDIHLVHGHPDPRTPFRYLDGVPAARSASAHVTAGSLAFGHTHVPCAFQRTGSSWAPIRAAHLARGVALDDAQVFWNPGGVHEAHDGGPCGCYALVDEERAVVTFHRAAD